MDNKLFDGAAIATGFTFFFDWLINNLALFQGLMGLAVGGATFIYTVIRIWQSLRR
jgi:hypothetical protein